MVEAASHHSFVLKQLLICFLHGKNVRGHLFHVLKIIPRNNFLRKIMMGILFLCVF